MGESALVFLSDGKSRTYPLGIASIPDLNVANSTICEFDLHRVDPGFVPTAIRILSLGFGGGSPGFDVGSVEARIAVDTSRPHGPYPCHGADSVSPNQALLWIASQAPDSVSLYLGTDPNATDPANATPVQTLPGDANSFQPRIPLLLGGSYYWRVVEHHGNSTRLGEAWQFTVSPYLHVENFESYAHSSELLYDLENFQYAPWLETSTASAFLSHGSDAVKAGCHAVALEYDCKNGMQARLFRYFYSTSENWTSPNAKYLEMSFKGAVTNPLAHTLVMKVEDSFRRSIQMTYDSDPNHIRDGQWHTWRIDLDTLGNLDLSRIGGIHVGVQAFDSTPASQSQGMVYLDEIHISPDIPLPRPPVPLLTDLDQDSQLSYKDLTLFSEAWLYTDQDILTVEEPNSPWCYLPFDSDASDVQGHAQTSPSGVFYIENESANFNSPDTALHITNGYALNQFTRGITISFWQLGLSSIHRVDTLVCSDYVYPKQAPEIAIGLGLWEDPEALYWQCGARQEPNNLLTGIHQASEQWSEQWNHWAFTKDFFTGQMAIYLNGRPLYHGQGQATGLTQIEILDLGNGWYRDYDGLMDDFRIHDYALGAGECAYLATHGTGVLPQPVIMPSDFNQDGQVDFQDFAFLASEWLD